MSKQIDSPPPPLRACGTFSQHLDEIGTTRRVNTLLGEPGDNKEKKPYVEYPVWFAPRGVRLFDIDTGIGIVKCCTPNSKDTRALTTVQDAFNEAQLAWDLSRSKDKDGNPTGSGTPEATKALDVATERLEIAKMRFLFGMVMEIPEEWVNEGPKVAEGELSLDTGAKIPPPSGFRDAKAEVQELYFSLLPHSLGTQIFTGYGLMKLPFIAYEDGHAAIPS